MGSYNGTSATLSDPSLDERAEMSLTRRIFLSTVVPGTWPPQIPLRSAAIACSRAILTVQSFCGQEYSHPRCDVESWNSPILENGLLPLPTSSCLCQASAAVSANRLNALFSSSFALVRHRRRPSLTSPGVVVTGERWFYRHWNPVGRSLRIRGCMIHLSYSHGTLAAESCGYNVSWSRNAEQPPRLSSRRSIVGA